MRTAWLLSSRCLAIACILLRVHCLLVAGSLRGIRCNLVAIANHCAIVAHSLHNDEIFVRVGFPQPVLCIEPVLGILLQVLLQPIIYPFAGIILSFVTLRLLLRSNPTLGNWILYVSSLAML